MVAQGPSWHGASRDGSVGGRRRVRAGEMALVKLNLRAAHRGGT